eukprot:jgi/Tetstr1/459343/TSEL_004738.t1
MRGPHGGEYQAAPHQQQQPRQPDEEDPATASFPLLEPEAAEPGCTWACVYVVPVVLVNAALLALLLFLRR